MKNALLSAQSGQEALQYVDQMQQQGEQVVGAATMDNYKVFVQNAKQVTAALAPILEGAVASEGEGGGKKGLEVLPGPLRGELCKEQDC